MTKTMTLTKVRTIEDDVNDVFCNIDAGFVNSHNEPAMTTPAVALLSVQTLVVGSTVCLVC